MPRKANILNVRCHLEHLQLVLDGYKRYGDCPAIQTEFARLSLVNRAILRKSDTKRAEGNRHDLYVGAKQ